MEKTVRLLIVCVYVNIYIYIFVYVDIIESAMTYCVASICSVQGFHAYSIPPTS